MDERNASIVRPRREIASNGMNIGDFWTRGAGLSRFLGGGGGRCSDRPCLPLGLFRSRRILEFEPACIGGVRCLGFEHLRGQLSNFTQRSGACGLTRRVEEGIEGNHRRGGRSAWFHAGCVTTITLD